MLCDQGVTALHVASHYGHGPVAAQLLEAKADPNLARNDGSLILTSELPTLCLLPFSLFCGDVTS